MRALGERPERGPYTQGFFCLAIMKIKINDKTTETSAATLKELVDKLQLPANGVAIALDSKMVQRSCWADTPLKEGVNVIIIKAACGG